MTQSTTGTAADKSNSEQDEGAPKQPAASSPQASVPAASPLSPNTAAPDKAKEATADTLPEADSTSKDSAKTKEKKPLLTWDRSIDILKLVATVWVALLGSIVTMQFNERQHELNRIEAIAQMLPHMAEDTKSKSGESDHMGRDGAIWAIFRTANNRKMLRDLAALFPDDIYRVVSSIAIGGELDHDSDAIVALQVSSEKLAAQYSADPKRADTASKLYAQALALKTRSPEDHTPLRVLDLTAQSSGSKPTDDQLTSLIKSINDLADQHLKDIENSSTKKKSGSSHWESKQLYLRARNLGADNKDDQILQQVMRADLALASLYVADQLADDAFKYFKDALECEAGITGKPLTDKIKALDKDGDGFAALSELSEAVKEAQARFKEIQVKYKDKGVELKS